MESEKQRTSKINLTQTEITRLENALKNPEFRDLLVEYSREINDPENRAKYEKEILQLEASRRQEAGNGPSVPPPIFLHPKPGFVIKTFAQQLKVFVNICSDPSIGKAENCQGVDPVSNKSGVNWSIPYSVTGSRKDVDKAGKMCEVYDVIFHPGTLELASNNVSLMGLINDIALDAVEKAGSVALDRKKISFPKMKFKGVFHPTVIRNGNNKAKQDDNPKKSEAKIPKYTIKYQHKNDLESTAMSKVKSHSIYFFC